MTGFEDDLAGIYMYCSKKQMYFWFCVIIMYLYFVCTTKNELGDITSYKLPSSVISTFITVKNVALVLES